MTGSKEARGKIIGDADEGEENGEAGSGIRWDL